MSKKQIYYSDKYTDDEYEYRHVMLPKDLAKMVPKTHLMSETEWRNLGVQQSQGEIFSQFFLMMKNKFYTIKYVHSFKSFAKHI